MSYSSLKRDVLSNVIAHGEEYSVSHKSGWIRQLYVRPKVLYIPDPQGIYSSQLRSQLQHLGIHLERVELLTVAVQASRWRLRQRELAATGLPVRRGGRQGKEGWCRPREGEKP